MIAFLKKKGILFLKKKGRPFFDWHERLGHVRLTRLKMLFMQMLNMNAINISDDFDCKVCNLLKLTRKVNREIQKRTFRKLEKFIQMYEIRTERLILKTTNISFFWSTIWLKNHESPWWKLERKYQKKFANDMHSSVWKRGKGNHFQNR